MCAQEDEEQHNGRRGQSDNAVSFHRYVRTSHFRHREGQALEAWVADGVKVVDASPRRALLDPLGGEEDMPMMVIPLFEISVQKLFRPSRPVLF